MLDRLEAYTKTPIVKLGRRGCIVKLDSKYIHVPGLKFNTIDPTGAGDNFLTGLIYGLYHELPLVDCIRYGNIMGGLCTEVLGCFRWDPVSYTHLDVYKRQVCSSSYASLTCSNGLTEARPTFHQEA